MIRKIILGIGMLAMSGIANAAIIVSESAITGADMAGMEVTVTFGDDTTESVLWQVIADNNGETIEDAEGRIGGAIADTWSLQQQGYTLGGVDEGIYYGLWTLMNSNGLGIKNVVISGLIAGTNRIAFDIIAGDSDLPDNGEVFPGSNGGQAFVTDFPGALGSYSNQVDPAYNDLFYTLTIDFESLVQQGQTVDFFADTDAVNVSEPSILALMLLGLGFAARRTVRAQR